MLDMRKSSVRVDMKERPFTLSYEGKKDEEEILRLLTPKPLSFQDITYLYNHDQETEEVEKPGKYFLGENIEVLRHFLTEEEVKGKVQLVYIDPPYGTGQVFSLDRKRGRAHSVSQPMEGDLGYSDTLTGPDFVEFLRERLVLIREILSEEGLIFVHIDEKYGFEVKLILDEVFGRRNFVNHIARIASNPKNFSRKAFGSQKDMILVYSKTRDYVWNESASPYSEEEIARLFPFVDENGERYTTNPLHAPGETKDGPTGRPWRGILPPPGRHWRYPPEKLDELDAQGLIVWSKNGVPRKRVYARDRLKKGKKLQDVWEFKDPQNPVYPTEKNLDMLKIIVATASRPGDLVLDCFAGSGTTLIAAVQLNRKAIGVDNSIEALEAFWIKSQNHDLTDRFQLLRVSST
jgi:adenine-specific DNA-methyltransferase